MVRCHLYCRLAAILCGLFLLIVFSTDRACAQLSINLTAVSKNTNGTYTFTYDVTLGDRSILRKGDYFTIYDFYALKSGTNSQPPNWSFSSSKLGRTPRVLHPSDNPSVPNLTWTYTGPTIGPGPVDLGLFKVTSADGKVATTNAVSQVHRYDPGNPDNNTLLDSLSYTGSAHAFAGALRKLAFLWPPVTLR